MSPRQATPGGPRRGMEDLAMDVDLGSAVLGWPAA